MWINCTFQQTRKGILDLLLKLVTLDSVTADAQLLVCQVSCAGCRVPGVVCRMSCARCGVPHVVCQVWCAACRVPGVLCRMLCAGCRVPNVVCLMSCQHGLGTGLCSCEGHITTLIPSNGATLGTTNHKPANGIFKEIYTNIHDKTDWNIFQI